ncbi:MAG: hypothetical protein JOZ77_08525 [Candidatus Eremiobacteraeota bacterium]|nr:hypothetical protein [Candidatus Eremiobacteraeota bacterium]
MVIRRTMQKGTKIPVPSAIVSVAMLAACSGSGSLPASLPLDQIRTLALRVQDLPGTQRQRKPGGLYVGVFGAGYIPEFTIPDRKDLGPRCSDTMPLAGGVNGIAVDAHRILYVPYNYNSVHDVATFGPDCGVQGPQLVDQYDVADVAVNDKTGTVYVGNAQTGNVDVFKKGATTPTGALHNSQHGGSGFGVAVDSAGNVFNSGSTIVEFPRGHNKGSTALALSGLTGPLGLALDSKNNLIVANEYNVVVYAPPYNGAPTYTIATKRFCLYVAVDATNTNLYVSEQKNNAVDVYTYPSGTYEYSITDIPSRSVGGVALDPPSRT